MEVVWLFLVFLRASALSVSGSTALPLLRHDLLTAGFTTDERIIQALTIGRLGSGPGGLFIVALGYFSMGIVGAIAALVATMLPPLLILPFASYLRPRLDQARINGAIRGLALASSGLVIATSVQLLRTQGSGGLPTWWQLGIVAGAFALGVQGRRHPLWSIGGGALVGLLLAGRV